MLSDRKQKILKAVTDEYIKRAVPISSGEIKNKYFDDISSATIRTELSTLEEMGYLVQPHTSAGRIPSPMAYKFYVENFLPKRPLKKNEIAQIDQSFTAKFQEIQDIVKTAAKVISDVTNYTSVIVLKNINVVKIKEIKLVKLDEFSALVIIITDSGIIRDKVISLSKNSGEEFINEANMLVNKIFGGLTVADLKKGISYTMAKELQTFKELLDNVLEILISYGDDKESNVIMEGESKLLEYPEASLDSAKNFLTVIDNKQNLADLIDGCNDIEFSVKIGKDEACGMDKCAIVTAKYMVNGEVLGHAGVIGPERMDYSKVMSVLSYVGETLDTIIKS